MTVSYLTLKKINHLKIDQLANQLNIRLQSVEEYPFTSLGTKYALCPLVKCTEKDA